MYKSANPEVKVEDNAGFVKKELTVTADVKLETLSFEMGLSE